jgi:hypothetical protein
MVGACTREATHIDEDDSGLVPLCDECAQVMNGQPVHVESETTLCTQKS